MDNNRPKVGIALSGASGRAIAHIAVLEVLKENNIPIDIIVGCSSGALIAAAYGTNTLDFLKGWFYRMSFRKLLPYWSTKGAKGAIFHLNNKKANAEINNVIKGMTFEQVQPKIGFVAADIDTGELITLNKGDMLKAFKASSAVPGIFEPVVWDGRILVDGGLVNIVPTLAAKEMGADIVIGVNLAATKFIYEKKMPIWRGYRFLTRFTGLQFVREYILPILLSPRLLFRIDSQSDILEEEDIKIPRVFTMLSKAIDHSFRIEEQWDESQIACDLMLEPVVKHFGKTEFKSLEQIYQEGRRATIAALPEIRSIIANYKPS